MKRIVAVLAVLVLIVAGCDRGTRPDLVDAPGVGAIVDTSAIPVSGTLPTDLPRGGVLTVAGTVVPVNSDRTWHTTLPATPDSYTTTFTVVYKMKSDTWSLQRTVVTGPKIAKGDFVDDGVGMRFTNHGLASLGPLIQDLAGGAFDIGPMLTSQHPLFTSKMLTFTITGNAYEAGMGTIGLDASSTAGGVKTHIDIDDLYVGVDMHITDNMAINSDCKLELGLPKVAIDATFDMSPLASAPTQVDVNLIGNPVVDPGTVNYKFISGICDTDSFLIGDIVNSVAGPQIQSMVGGAFSSNLADPDGAGPQDSPIAAAIQTALAGISVAGPVGEAVNATLDAPFSKITEGATGIDFEADSRFTTDIGTGPGQCPPAPGAPTLPATYDVPGAYPTLGDTTPSGDPYGLGLVISASSFNQLLGSMTECGSINSEVTDFSGVPLTSTLLSLLVPEFGKLPANTPMKVVVTPTYAPFLTSKPGANGEPAQLMLANLLLDFRTVGVDGADGATALRLSVDAPLGFDLTYDAAAGALKPTITPPAAKDVVARVVTNTIGANPTTVTSVFESVFPSFVAPLADTFQAFPLPGFMGLDLSVADIERQGNAFVLYANLAAQPQTRLANVQISDRSTGDNVVDSTFDVHEWRHIIRKKVTSTSVGVDFKGMIGADACCTVEDESISANGAYTVAMDVLPENGDTWHLDLNHFIKGAHTLIDEKVALEDGGGKTQFVTGLQGRVSTDNGATWQNFDFNPSVTSVTHKVRWGNGGEGTTNTEFTGSKALRISGTTATHVIVTFDVSLYALSDSNVAAPAAGGDEVAIRFGANDTITNGFTAGGYPGLGNRNILDDGWFSRIVLTTN